MKEALTSFDLMALVAEWQGLVAGFIDKVYQAKDEVTLRINVSREEQRERFLERLEDPAKNWKFSLADIGERELWGKYQAAYQEVIRHTSTKQAPWHIVPADHKWFRNFAIAECVVEALRPWKAQWLKKLAAIGEQAKAELKVYRDRTGNP